VLTFLINQHAVTTEATEGTLLLDLIRDELRLPGTKEACREGECGACTVLVGRLQADGRVTYKACASCLLALGEVQGCHVVTVEGLEMSRLTAVQQLVVDHGASQCGFCTPGIVLSLTGYCLTSPHFTYQDAVDALDGNLCRCTGYVSIRQAARVLGDMLRTSHVDGGDRVAALVEAGVLPGYFKEVPARLAALGALPAGDRVPGAVLMGGGTDLLVQRPEALRQADLCFLSRHPELCRVVVDGDVMRVGGAVTLEDFRLLPEVGRHFPWMEEALLLHSSTILRNKATLAGNVVNASPVGDMTIILLALDARLVVEGGGRTRTVALRDFYAGYKKYDLACGEVVQEIVIPLAPRARFSFEKVSNRVILDIAAVNSAMLLETGAHGTISLLRISAGGVAPVPLLVPGLERFHGRLPDQATVAEIVNVVTGATRPIDDIRGTAEYKRLLLRQLVEVHFDKCRGDVKVEG
jgi:xanthine dehydrogenase small subunit